MEIDDYVTFLREDLTRKIYLKPYLGNSGDGLIWMGNEFLFQELGISRARLPQEADLILWPGGNPTMWQGNLDGWQECWKRWPQVPFGIGPATFQTGCLPWATLLKESPTAVHAAFARDRESHSVLQNAGLPKTIYLGLAHDPAFHLRGSDWLATQRQASTSDFVLASFRSDHEGVSEAKWNQRMGGVPGIQWIQNRLNRKRAHERLLARVESVKNRCGNDDQIIVEDVSSHSFDLFVERVRHARQVHTDRLHCMILALMLDKKVFAYQTSYRKLEAVSEFSLSQWGRIEFVNE
ncbi:MAG: polysaccharide pyruvyl transferase family protein [Verrucomicrobiales bacterium]